jgi:hypothetical protein
MMIYGVFDLPLVPTEGKVECGVLIPLRCVSPCHGEATSFEYRYKEH